MKKITSLILALVLAFSLVSLSACGDKATDDKNSDSAESWNRLVMHTPVIFRNIHCPDLRRDPDGKGRCDACHGKGQQKRRP